MHKDLIYQIALTLIPHIGPVQAKILLEHLNVNEIFNAKRSGLEKIEGIGATRAAAIKGFSDFSIAEKEIAFIEKFNIAPLFIGEAGYPRRLLNCYDSPIILYYRGLADLNASKILAIVGTRNNTDYGKQVTEKMIKELSLHNVIVVSGLAYGIDALAHKAAIKNRVPTIGVLAHGLDQIYPSNHINLAKEMIHENGGLLTEFRSVSKPDKHNFPVRNRIVAGMSDATIVIETGIRGGSMITAELSNGYNRDVFAVPGKITDPKSAGCNSLIKNNKAIALTSVEDLVEILGWENSPVLSKKQKEFFIELSSDEKMIVGVLKENETTHIDELRFKCGLSNSAVASSILRLELENVVVSLPGKQYRLS